MVEALAELDHNGSQIDIPRIIDEVSELVQVIINCPFTLKVSCSASRHGSGSVALQGIQSEFIMQ